MCCVSCAAEVRQRATHNRSVDATSNVLSVWVIEVDGKAGVRSGSESGQRVSPGRSQDPGRGQVQGKVQGRSKGQGRRPYLDHEFGRSQDSGPSQGQGQGKIQGQSQGQGQSPDLDASPDPSPDHECGSWDWVGITVRVGVRVLMRVSYRAVCVCWLASATTLSRRQHHHRRHHQQQQQQWCSRTTVAKPTPRPHISRPTPNGETITGHHLTFLEGQYWRHDWRSAKK